MTAGYSGTPLPKKLGVKDGSRVAVLGPDGARLAQQLDAATRLAGTKPFDVIVLFTKSRAAFEDKLEAMRAKLAQDGGMWIAWPKKASGVATDMTEQVVRDVALPTGLVDNKVCAIDEIWSGLRLVIRKELRR